MYVSRLFVGQNDGVVWGRGKNINNMGVGRQWRASTERDESVPEANKRLSRVAMMLMEDDGHGRQTACPLPPSAHERTCCGVTAADVNYGSNTACGF